MTPQDLYSSPYERILYPFSDNSDGVDYGFFARGAYFNHIPELDQKMIHTGEFINSDRLCVRIHSHYQEDHRRFWRLSSGWLDDQPFMIMQNAGREGDDHVHRFVTDNTLYAQAIVHIYELYISTDNDGRITPTTEVGELFNFYGHRLSKPLE